MPEHQPTLDRGTIHEMTDVVHNPQRLWTVCEGFRSSGARVGLVPTMGALHRGHLSLVRAVRQAGAQRVVVTIFVNPTQFGPGEDYERYPRTLDEDLARCRDLKVDLVFAPSKDVLYPSRFQTAVLVGEITKELEGKFRPEHFRGVTTIVAKLFNAVGPCVAAFGQKDYQQWRVIDTMTRDLNMPVQVIGCPTVRESDGLAMSSRNRYLKPSDRERALAIHRGLEAARRAFADGERDPRQLERRVRDMVEPALDCVDYVAAADPDTLALLLQPVEQNAVILVAGHIGSTRLIDNALMADRELSETS